MEVRMPVLKHVATVMMQRKYHVWDPAAVHALAATNDHRHEHAAQKLFSTQVYMGQTSECTAAGTVLSAC